MTIAEWINFKLEETGIGTQSELARRAGISATTISVGKKRGYFSDRVMKKLESYLGEYNPDEELPDIITDDEFFREAVTTEEECLTRLKGNSCPTSSKLCYKCYNILKDLDVEIPISRGECRLAHGWVKDGGVLYFQDEDGTLVPEERL